MRYEVHQIHLSHAQYDQMNAGELQGIRNALLEAKVHENVVPALKALLYKHVATIEAEDLEDVFEVGNIGPEHQIERYAPMHSVSVGDIIRDPEGRTFVVAGIGFTQLGG